MPSAGLAGMVVFIVESTHRVVYYSSFHKVRSSELTQSLRFAIIQNNFEIDIVETSFWKMCGKDYWLVID